jgi:membrane protease YdiL (CAAX protease family)
MSIVADLVALAPFALLLAAVIGLWIHRAIWAVALVAAIGTAYYTGALTGLAGPWLAILAALALAYRRVRGLPRSAQSLLLQWLSGLAFVVLALAIALAMLPGFPRVTLTEAVPLTPDARPYGIGLGFSKVVTGILILGIINTARVSSTGELGRVLARSLPIFLVIAPLVMMLTLATGFTDFDPKWTTLFLVWAPMNLFFTCLSEEAFFRGFIQQELSKPTTAWAVTLAIAISALLFGATHLGGGLVFALASTIAGLGYALAYHLTQRIEAAIAVHFAVNATHFLLFTYPALA